MKVLITFFPIDDMGGIINHHEQLCAGLQELGHEVTTKLLMWRDVAPSGLAGGRGCKEFSGLEFDQRRGYSWKNADIIVYKGRNNLSKWRRYAESFDLIIWQVAVPTKRAENSGNTDWLHLYDIAGPGQIAIIHDGNFLDSYPWLFAVGEHLTGLACVHHCAFNSARSISVPSALILNPQDVRYPDLSEEAFNARRKGFLSLQTFKAWKRVPELVAAVPYMSAKLEKNLAGKGIDYYYLTSKDKCKYPGIWDSAEIYGLNYLDVITNEQRDAILGSVTALIDASWSRKYAKIGGHFNRVLVDAIMAGAIPIARNWGISNNEDGDGELFRSGINCLTIPWDATPCVFGHMVTLYCNLPYEDYFKLMSEAVKLLPMFERKRVAQRFIDLANGLIDQEGETTLEVITKGSQVLTNFFVGN